MEGSLKDEFIYIDETSMNEIVRLNYEGKLIQELTDEEICHRK